jgi:hypothetical protein
MRRCKRELLLRYKGVNDILIVDLDKQRCIQEEGTELNIIPESLITIFKHELIELIYLFRNKRDENTSQQNISLCWIFLRFFVSTCGNYKDYIKPGYTEHEDHRFMVINQLGLFSLLDFVVLVLFYSSQEIF